MEIALRPQAHQSRHPRRGKPFVLAIALLLSSGLLTFGLVQIGHGIAAKELTRSPSPGVREFPYRPIMRFGY